ncbi:Bestrophin, RFP-TM, chloride channel-domain-containing protein [Dichomitus squalens]|uniref:Bestrophin, RFP-TM, chloride channel-domain-containing protein n=1 Tax=Dichomitus squalens TaxID=114155 RepID=A0A4Q9MKC6_9APHY|nr:Bestrophin, RFP-TM, chloride channel-domain-containing protein [Dichomitus squalens]
MSNITEPIGAKPRSATGHVLLPAFDNHQNRILVPVATTQNLVSWTFGRGTVVWRIWPAVLLHTVFAAAVVTLSMETRVHLGIPNVMLTLLGVVIGFVISYRASSGYDRYWQGRSSWSDIARTTRTLTRLIWIHIPLKIVPAATGADGKSDEVDASVARHVMAEKRVALDLVEGFVVAVKHHLRGEMGIYYEDLYPLVKPLHNHVHHRRDDALAPEQPTVNIDTVVSPVRDFQPEAPLFPIPTLSPTSHTRASTSGTSSPGPAPTGSHPEARGDPVIPPINSYGTTLPPPLRGMQSTSSFSSVSSDSERRPLLPGSVPQIVGRRGLFGSVSGDLIPFAGFWRGIGSVVGLKGRALTTVEADIERRAGQDDDRGGVQRRWADETLNGEVMSEDERRSELEHVHPRTAHLRAALVDTTDRLGITHAKHRPRVAGGGENLPLEILRALSIWLSVLDERSIVPGGALGGMYGCLAAFEDSLATLERILTTPLPFVYSVHIRHTVWIYLFFLPFQLVDQFGYYTIPGVGIAAFIYLGLIAAGEEIEQPFGYDENDLDLDFFCNAIIHADIERIKRISCPNVYLGSHHSSANGEHTIPSAHETAIDRQAKVYAVFGTIT